MQIVCLVMLKSDEDKLMPRRLGVVESVDENQNCTVSSLTNGFPTGIYHVSELVKRGEIERHPKG